MAEPTKKTPTSISPGPALLAHIQSLGPRSTRDGVSRAVERMASRYAYMVRGSLPAWSIEDWAIAIQALEGHDANSVSGIRVLGLVIQSAVEHKRVGSSSALDGSTAGFAYQAKRLNEVAQVAVAETAEGYWRRHHVLDLDLLREQLHQVGAPGFDAANVLPEARTVAGSSDATM